MLKNSRRLRLAASAGFVLLAVILAYGALCHFGSESEEGIHRRLKLVCKGTVARALAGAYRTFPFVDRSAGQPTPLSGSGDYCYQDLSDPYFQRVREDPRLRELFQDSTFCRETAIAMTDFLRDRFRHAAPLGDENGSRLLDLLDRVDRGERFSCGPMSAMLVQLFQAKGRTARRVFLKAHVVAEVWIADLNKWVMFDPLYNMHYVDDHDEPLSALQIHHMLNSNQEAQIHARAGASVNTVYGESAAAGLFEAYKPGFAVSYFDKWVSRSLPRWHPCRMPSTSVLYYSESVKPGALGTYYVNHVSDPRLLYRSPEERK